MMRTLSNLQKISKFWLTFAKAINFILTNRATNSNLAKYNAVLATATQLKLAEEPEQNKLYKKPFKY